MAPMFVHLYPRLAEAARSCGYALAVHGTLGRDYDLIAVPWTERAGSPAELVAVLEKVCGGWAPEFAQTGVEGPQKMPRPFPHGREAWLIYFKGLSDYIDLSVTPRATLAQPDDPSPAASGEESRACGEDEFTRRVDCGCGARHVCGRGGTGKVEP